MRNLSTIITFTHLAFLRTSSLKFLAFSHILTAAFGTSAEGTFYDLVQEDEDSEGRLLGNRLSPAGGSGVDKVEESDGGRSYSSIRS